MQTSTREHVEKATGLGMPLAEYARQNGLKSATLYKSRQTMTSAKPKAKAAAAFVRVAMPPRAFAAPIPSKYDLCLVESAPGLWTLSICGLGAQALSALVVSLATPVARTAAKS